MSASAQLIQNQAEDYIGLVDVNFHLPEICCWPTYC